MRPISRSTGIESVWGDTHNAFSVEGRDIVATSGWQIEVYTLEGARVPGNGLCPGIYIVKAYGADGVSSKQSGHKLTSLMKKHLISILAHGGALGAPP